MRIAKKIKVEDLLIGAVIVSSLSLRNFPAICYLSQITFLAFFLARGCIRVNKQYLAFYGSFVMLSFFSLFWAEDDGYALKAFLAMIQPFALCLIMTSYIRDEEKAESIINCFVISSAVLIINLLVSTSPEEWHNIIFFSSGEYVDVATSKGRLGPSVGIHPNAFGVTLLICTFFVLYRFLTQKKYFLLLSLLVGFLLLSKSRGSLLIALMGCLLIILCMQRSRTRQMLWLMGCILVAIIGLWAVINVPVLYKLVGYRMEGLFALFSAGKKVDASTTARLDFMLIAFELFLSKPILGIGLNNFAVIAYRDYHIWGKVSAHSNFFEILADLGALGFFLYYFPIVRAGSRLFKKMQVFRKRSELDYKLAAFLFAITLSLLANDLIYLSYDKEATWYIFMYIITMDRLLTIKQDNTLKKGTYCKTY